MDHYKSFEEIFAKCRQLIKENQEMLDELMQDLQQRKKAQRKSNRNDFIKRLQKARKDRRLKQIPNRCGCCKRQWKMSQQQDETRQCDRCSLRYCSLNDCAEIHIWNGHKDGINLCSKCCNCDNETGKLSMIFEDGHTQIKINHL